ncbi:MAG TPA: 23S rRNA (uracil(1939)-C(5))-methyltransferase RlmD [Bacteroidetes bacterium]|nr:23S rRNA (uracil(1939)-C(5))-methyltransferase RlmD [Bacteroidota bacterium]
MGRRRKIKRIIEQVKITGIADRGKSIGRTEEGQVLFVENVAPGDVVDVLVLRKKKGVLSGIPNHFHSYSADRVEPFCQHFGICGGCKWQHLSYEAQLKEKEIVVRDAIKRIGKLTPKVFLPILPAVETKYYRNKLEFAFSNKRWLTKAEIETGRSNLMGTLGFHRPGAFDKIVDIEHCYFQPDPSNDIRNYAKELAIEQGLEFFATKEESGFLRHLLLRVFTTGETMVILSFYKEEEAKRKAYLDQLIAKFPQITSLYYCINPKKNDYIMDLEMIHYHGAKKIKERLGEVVFHIGPKSFFQTNTKQAERLYNVVVDFCELKGTENVYDLYTGLGSIALYIANKCKQVVGIEEISLAIEDAKINSQLNDIENAIFYAGDVKEILSEAFAKKHGKPDLVISDPPRAGMHAKVIDLLLNLAAPRIVYVSCNPSTQARDLNLLSAKYDLIKIQPVDMFPHTHHIESVALLQLQQKTA